MKRVLIYCASGYGERVAYSLNADEYKIVAFVDSNPETWGRELYGGTVIEPSEINKMEYDLIIIGISFYEKEIRNDLVQKYGVDEQKIAVYQPMVHGINWEEERIVMLRKCISMIRERKVSGNMAEVGVYQGEFSKLFNRYLPEKKLYLFDTFEGFDTKRDKVKECDIEIFKDTSIDYVLNKMVTPENCIVRQGYFPDTAKGLEDTFCLVSLDCDLYNPILAGLEYFYPRLEKGGYIFIHDFGSYHFEEVKEAVYKFCNENDVALVPIVDRCLSVIIAK